MNTLTETAIKTLPRGFFTTHDVAAMFPGSNDRRYGLIKRAVADEEIIRIRRGLYCLSPAYGREKLNLFTLAQLIYGPSYISLESALSAHGWIPEAVYTTTSVSFGKSKEFNTPLGSFSYCRIPQKEFFAGVEKRTDDHGNTFLLAKPSKALADYVYLYKKVWSRPEDATRDMRIEYRNLQTIPDDELDLLAGNYRSRRVKRFIAAVRRETR